MWRLVMSEPQVATLEQIERSWSLSDIVRGNHMLSLREAAHRIAMEEAETP